MPRRNLFRLYSCFYLAILTLPEPAAQWQGTDNRGRKLFSRGTIMRSGLFFVTVFLVLFLFIPIYVTASSPSVSENVRHCLECHGNKDFSLELQKKEKLPLFIDINKFAGSVHGSLDCSACHAGFSADKHPERVLKNTREYAVSGSARCKTCHTKFKSAMHAKMTELAKKGGKVCVDCHGSHSIQRARKGASGDSAYCLACHDNGLELSFSDGESQSLRVDTEALSLSVHGKLYCSDCHFGFSAEEHPQRTFRSRRDYTGGL